VGSIGEGIGKRLAHRGDVDGRSSSPLAGELIAEGLTTRRHPLTAFRDGPTGRRAALVGGPDVWEVIGGLIGGDVLVEKRVDRAIDPFGLRREQVDAVLAYYAEHTDEIDTELEAYRQAADEAEALVWVAELGTPRG
jgi:hypothetical protein